MICEGGTSLHEALTSTGNEGAVEGERLNENHDRQTKGIVALWWSARGYLESARDDTACCTSAECASRRKLIKQD